MASTPSGQPPSDDSGNSKNEETRFKQPPPQQDASLQAVLAQIEERIDKRSAQLKKIEKALDLWDDDPPVPSSSSSSNPASQSNSDTQTQRQTIEDAEEERLSKTEALRLAKELSEQIEQLRALLTSSLRETVTDARKVLSQKA